jgi:predicted MFS family arabinose efflux permease
MRLWFATGDTGSCGSTRCELLRISAVPTQQRRAVWWLGACQCVLWGVLYYGFPVLLVPMERALGLPRTAVAGAFSAALLVMALVAPAIGRRFDAGQAARLIRLGFGLALAGLAMLAFARNAAMLYAAWVAIGLAMGMLLYESAFALVIRAVRDESDRLRALAAVTVIGGLASTLFLPLLSVLVERWDWRVAVLTCMAAMLGAAWLFETRVLPTLAGASTSGSPRRATRSPWPPRLPALMVLFASGTLAGMALTTLLIPLLLARGVPPPTAALVLAALGIAQLPGRLWLLRGGRSKSPRALRALPVALQAAGLAGVAIAPIPALAAVGVGVFGVGAGLQTLARPWLIQHLYGPDAAGHWNGEVARVQGFARALGPVAAAGAASLVGTHVVLAAAGILMITVLPIALRLRVPVTDSHATCNPAVA